MSKQTHDVPRLLSKRPVNVKRKYWGQKNRNSSYITVSSSNITVTVVEPLMGWKICNMSDTEVCLRRENENGARAGFRGIEIH